MRTIAKTSNAAPKLSYAAALVCLLIIPIYASDADEDLARAEKIEEIQGYGSVFGEWNGKVFVRDAPKELFQTFTEDKTIEQGIGVRLRLKADDSLQVSLKYPSDDDWSELKGEEEIRESNLGWYVTVNRSGGVWFEKYWLFFARTAETEAAVTFLRTVHNWHLPNGVEDPVTYNVYGEGAVSQTVVGEISISKMASEQ